MIYFGTPYSMKKDIGDSYNQFMELLPNADDWACFTDGDAMFTVRGFGHKIQEVITANPDIHTFTCMTNRVMTPYQRDMEHWAINDMSSLWNIGQAQWDANGTEVQDITDDQPFSGVMIMTQKKTWVDIGGFKEGIGMLGVDNQFHLSTKEHGKRVGLMKGIYLMHYYRNGNPNDKGHLL